MANDAIKYQADLYQQRLKDYATNPTKCQQCNQELPYFRKSEGRKFCNSSCAATCNNTKRIRVKWAAPKPPRIPRQKSAKVLPTEIRCAKCNVSFCPLS